MLRAGVERGGNPEGPACRAAATRSQEVRPRSCSEDCCWDISLVTSRAVVNRTDHRRVTMTAALELYLDDEEHAYPSELRERNAETKYLVLCGARWVNHRDRVAASELIDALDSD